MSQQVVDWMPEQGRCKPIRDLRRDQDLPEYKLTCMISVAAKIARRYSLTLAQLRGRSRDHRIVVARDHAMAVISWSCGATSTQIGDFMNRDHTTVLSAIARHERVINGDPDRRLTNV
jgi:chromosomal replication initiation ATPase DnaA